MLKGHNRSLSSPRGRTVQHQILQIVGGREEESSDYQNHSSNHQPGKSDAKNGEEFVHFGQPQGSNGAHKANHQSIFVASVDSQSEPLQALPPHE